MTVGTDTCSCGALLASDQRFCLSCGARTPLAAAAFAAAFGATRPSVPSAPAAPGTALGDSRPFARLLQLPELSAGSAFAIFSVVLGTSAWAGARVTAAPLAEAPLYALTQPGPAVAPAPPAVGPAATDSSTVDTSEAVEPTESTSDATATRAEATDSSSSTSSSSSSRDEEDPAATTPAKQAIAPTLDRVVVLSLGPLPYEALGDPDGPAPYLSRSLPKEGVLLRRFGATAPSALASRIALLSGQAPNPATLAECTTATPLTPGTIGADDQAEGSGCVYSPEVFTVGDLLASSERSWRVYTASTPATCRVPDAGTPWPANAPVPLLFAATSGAPGCEERLADLASLAGDVTQKDGPALSYVQLDHETPEEADRALRELVPTLQRALAATPRSAIVILPSATPASAAEPDRSSCCTRPWEQADATGGGRTGAIVLSSLAQRGLVLDEPVDHYDALKTISVALGVRPLGYAGRDEVTGLPADLWTSAATDS